MSLYIRYPASGGSGGGAGVVVYPTLSAFPATAPNGTLAVAGDTNILYEYSTNSNSWEPIASNAAYESALGAVLTVGTLDSATASVNGAVIAGNDLILQSASATRPGLVNNTTQSLSGNKTFTGSISASNLSGTNTGNVTLGTANGLSLVSQALSLGLSSTSTTGALSSTDWNTFNNKQATLSLGAVGSSPNANAASLSGAVLNLQPANGSNPGVVSTASQTFAGAKTFSGLVNADGGIDLSSAGTLTIGATNSNTINIGNSGAVVNIQGTTIYENTPQLLTADPLITVNHGGGAGSGQNAGIEVEENNVITGYAETSGDRNSWILKAPNTAGVATITPGSSGITLDQSSHNAVTLTAVGSSPNANAASLSGQALTLQPADGSNPGVLTSGTQTIGGAKTLSGNLVVQGSTTLATSLTGPLKAASGVVSASAINLTSEVTGTLPSGNGGTGFATYATGDTIYASASNTLSKLSIGTSTQILQVAGGVPTWASFVAPTVQKFTSGTGTYTLPTSPRSPVYIRVRMVGGGGGGAGGGSTGVSDGSDGGNSTFGTTLLVSNGGAKGTTSSGAGAGGTASLGSGPVGLAFSGATGFSSTVSSGSSQNVGGGGGGSVFGGAGALTNNTGGAAKANTGSGGAGGGVSAAGAQPGSGGGAGGYVDAIITAPSASYAYAVGAAGTAGNAGTNGSAGGAGAAGILIVEEFYQ